MKKNLFLTLAFVVMGIMSLVAQTTAFIPYEGGYFVKEGDEWTEYRPADKTGKWSTYEQYKEDDTFFYIKNRKCRLAIPKLANDNIFIDREKNGKWEIVYNTIDIHAQCVSPNGLFYCYQDDRGPEHHGYFVRGDNGVWNEYAPGKKRGVWAQFKQIDETNDYFVVESTHNKVWIPKKPSLNFVITSPNHEGWRGGYNTMAIYDRSATYLYNFYVDSLRVVKRGGRYEDTNSGARISFDNRCNIQIAFGGKHYDFEYTSVELTELDGKEAVLFTIDNKNKVWLLQGGGAVFECKKIARKKYSAIGADVEDYIKVVEMLKLGTFGI